MFLRGGGAELGRESQSVTRQACPLLSDVPFVTTREQSCCFSAPALPEMGGAPAEGSPGLTGAPAPKGVPLASLAPHRSVRGTLFPQASLPWSCLCPCPFGSCNSQDSEACSAYCGLRAPLRSFPRHIQAFLSLS